MAANKTSKAITLVGVLGYIFLYLPLIVLIAFSFNSSRLNVTWTGWTLHWYYVLFNDQQLVDAIINSLLIALAASLLSVFLGTLAGISVYRYRPRLLSFLIMITIAAPELLLGVSLLLFFLLINFTLGFWSIVLAHITFCIGFVAITISTRMHSIDESLLDAARDLGASPFKAFTLILLPILLPGILAGALMAFTLSIDDFIITFFTAGVGTNTLPLSIYSMLRMGVTPEVNAASTIIILVVVVSATIITKLSGSLLKASK